VRQNAFQAGCRGFESRLPLFALDRLLSWPITGCSREYLFSVGQEGTVLVLEPHGSTTACPALGQQPASVLRTACPKMGCRNPFLDGTFCFFSSDSLFQKRMSRWVRDAITRLTVHDSLFHIPLSLSIQEAEFCLTVADSLPQNGMSHLIPEVISCSKSKHILSCCWATTCRAQRDSLSPERGNSLPFHNLTPCLPLPPSLLTICLRGICPPATCDGQVA
jgi:hypothetical protein